MLRRAKSLVRGAVREAAVLSLRILGQQQLGHAVEKLIASAVTDVDVAGATLRFMTATPLLQRRAQTVLSKEPDTIRWIDQFEANDVLWDIGANVGVFSIYAAKVKGVRVFAFEPSADNFMVLNRNIESNALDDRIMPYCIALAAATELGFLNSPSFKMGAALHQFGRRGELSRYSPSATCRTLGTIGFSIDDFVRQFNPAFPTRLKIDVDGIEWEILQGAEKTLHDPRLRSIMVELSISDQAENDRTSAWLSEAGFLLASRGEMQESGGHAGANHLFVRCDAVDGDTTSASPPRAT